MGINLNRKHIGVLAAVLFTLGSSQAMAGRITAIKADANGVVGAQVKVTVEGEDEGICGLRVEYGNGDVDVTKMSKDKDNFPRSFMKTYNKAGTYVIVAKGGKDGSTFGCTGEVKTQVVVAEAPKPAVPVAPAATMPGARPAVVQPTCPEGYNLPAKSINRRTGAFTCTAGKGALKPAKPLECPVAGTEYFTNKTGTQLGCRVPPAAKK